MDFREKDDTAEAVLRVLRRLPPETRARIAAGLTEAHSARLQALAADLSAALDEAARRAAEAGRAVESAEAIVDRLWPWEVATTHITPPAP